MSFNSSTGLVIVDCVPTVGHLLGGKQKVSEKINNPSHGTPRMGRYILDIRIHDFVSKGAVECDWVPEAGVFKL